MVKTRVMLKSNKSNLKGKITKRKIIKPTNEVKTKLKQLSDTEYKRKPISQPAVAKKTQPKGKFGMRLRNQNPEVNEQKHFLVSLLHNNIDYEQTEKAVQALYQFLEKTKKKSELLNEAQPIYLQVVCIKIPQTPIRCIRFNLKHTLVTDSSEICLIVSDKGKRKEHESTIEYYENILNEKGVRNIKTIVPFNELLNEHTSQFELKRKFSNLYDHFLVDARISGRASHLLGSIFYKNRKMPGNVKMDHRNLKKHIDFILKKAIMKMHSNGDTYTVEIGHTEMAQEEVYENVIQVAQEINNTFPGGFDNVRSLGIKTSKSVTVPVYLTLKQNKAVKVPICKPKLPKEYVSVTGSLSTYLNATATVSPEGDVILTKHKMEKAKNIPNELLAMNEDEVEGAEEDKEIQVTEQEDKKAHDFEESDDDDDLVKEEEMYLTNYEHELDEEHKKELKQQSKPKKKITNRKLATPN